MGKRIRMVIVGATLVVAHCLIGGTAFADSYTQDGKPCPPECVSDSMEIVTWYPSPYNEYEELRLYPISDSNSQCNSDNRGLIYYDSEDDKVKLCKGPAGLNNWQDLGGSEFWKASTTVSSNIHTDKSVKFGNYSTSSRPTCNTDTLGAVIFDTTKNNLYLCKSGGAWEPVGGYSYTQSFTTPGTNTFVVPIGITEIMIEVWSAGGGGGGGTGRWNIGGDGGVGGSSSVGSLIFASGGDGGSGSGGGGNRGTSSAPINISGQNGKNGTSGGGGGTGGFGAGNGGSGGGPGPDATGSGGGGGGGAYGKGTFDVTSGALYTIVVGGGGTAGGGGGCQGSGNECCCYSRGGTGGTGGNGKAVIYY